MLSLLLGLKDAKTTNRTQMAARSYYSMVKHQTHASIYTQLVFTNNHIIDNSYSFLTEVCTSENPDSAHFRKFWADFPRDTQGHN